MCVGGKGMVWGWFKCITFIVYFISVIITVIRKERLTQLTIMQNQWEPYACFPATRHPISGDGRVMGSPCKDRWSFAHLPAAHLLLSGQVPNRLWTRSWDPQSKLLSASCHGWHNLLFEFLPFFPLLLLSLEHFSTLQPQLLCLSPLPPIFSPSIFISNFLT